MSDPNRERWLTEATAWLDSYFGPTGTLNHAEIESARDAYLAACEKHAPTYDPSRPIKERVESFLRAQLDMAVGLLTNDQRRMFDRVFPSTISADFVEEAISLCDRTLRRQKEEK